MINWNSLLVNGQIINSGKLLVFFTIFVHSILIGQSTLKIITRCNPSIQYIHCSVCLKNADCFYVYFCVLMCSRCPFLHRTAGDTERRYHLRYYKTGSCIHETDAKGHCSKNGSHCAFAHGSHDLRSPVYDIRCPKELHVNKHQTVTLEQVLYVCTLLSFTL